MGYALSEMTGKAGAVGAFLTGPWGIALTIGVTMLAPFVSKLWEGSSAADKEAESLKTLEGATKALDEATGRLTKSKAEEIRQSEVATRKALTEAIAKRTLLSATLAAAQQPGGGGEIGQEAGAFANNVLARTAQGAIDANAKAIRDAQAALAGAGFARVFDGAAAATNKATAATQRYEKQLERTKAAYTRTAAGRPGGVATTEDDALAARFVRDAMRRHDAEKGGGASGAVAGDTAAAAAKLASATNDVERAQARLTIVRREANAELKAGAITQAQATAKIAAAEQALNGAQAAAKAHAGAVRDVAKATQEAEAADRRLESQAEQLRVRFGEGDNAAGRYLKTLGEIADLTARGKFSPEEGALFTLRATVQENERRNPGALKTSFDHEAVKRDIEAIEKHAEAQEEASAAARQTANDFKGAATTLAGAVSQAFGAKAGAVVSGIGTIGDTILNGKSKEAQIKSQQLADSISKLATKGFGISENVGKEIGKYAGRGIEGAATGAFANSIFEPLAKGLGLKTSKTGAQIGGAIGGMTGIPGGDIIGSILGSVVGGLFKKTKSGGATIGADGAISTSGNSASREAGAARAAGSVVDGVKQIASALGGTVGKLSPITIGTYGKNDEYRANTSGGTQLGGSKSKLANVEYFGSGEEGAAAALAYAIQLQVQRGAVEGLSSAVQKAIKSSSDMNAALQEALKVQNVEMIAKGLSGEFEKAFKDLEATAKDRVRIAKEYGLDLVAIEKRNGQDRAALVDQLTKQQAGALQSLVTDLTSGDLFEGSYKDKIAALDGRVAKARSDMDAGVTGAADTFADLLRQKLAAEKDAYGETAAYAASRNSTIAEAQAAIARVNQQITAAKSDPALATTNSALDENNSQNAEMIAELRTQNALLRQLADTGGSSTGGGYFDLSKLAQV